MSHKTILKQMLVALNVDGTKKPNYICSNVAAGKTSRPYNYRSLKSNIAPKEKIWCVSGVDNHPVSGGAGVLEWCLDEDDAKRMLAIMKGYPQFKDIDAHHWLTNHDKIHSKAQSLE